MKQLRAALVELTKTGVKEGDDPVPLVVVVDELDRCRPDYALALLEVIKHFFSVLNVQFVLGVNMEALGHSVRARYGAGIDADRYLRRFISLSMQLPDQTSDHESKPLVMAYFKRMAAVMKINSKAIEILNYQLPMVVRAHRLTMRDMNQLLSSLALVDPRMFIEKEMGWPIILASMLLFRVASPPLERKALVGTITLEDVHSFYAIRRQELREDDRDNYFHPAWVISVLWEMIITDAAKPEKDREAIARAYERFGRHDVRKVPDLLHRNHLSRFALLNVEQ